MDRTLWQDGVEVTQAQLVNEHTALEENILQRWTDGMQQGVVSGLEVTVSADPTKVDLAVGSGYAPNGEWIELAAAQAGLALSNYTVGLDNYVCLVYVEVPSRPEAHETDGSTRNTRATRSAKVQVFTLAELNALPAASVTTAVGDVDYAVDARDRVLICGIANANGLGVPLVEATDVTSTATRTRILSIVQPSVMTGVEIVAVSAGTATTAEQVAAGDSTNQNAGLKMTFTGSTEINLAYKAPGDTDYGTAQQVNAGGSPFTLLGDGDVHSIVVGVAVVALPPWGSTNTGSTTEVEESLAVTAFYDEAAVVLVGARDEMHRRTNGSVVPSVGNPHGVKLAGLGGGVQQAMGTVFLGGGLGATRAQAQVPHLYSAQSSASSIARTLVWHMVTTSGLVVRLYLTASAWEMTVNARWYADNSSAVWKKDSALSGSMKMGMGSAGYSLYSRAATAGDWADNAWSLTPFALIAGTGELTLPGSVKDLGLNLLGNEAGIHTPRVTAPFSMTAGMLRTLMWSSAGSPTTGFPTRIYIGNGLFEVTINAAWNQSLGGAGQWARDDAAQNSVLFRYSVNEFSYYMHYPSPTSSSPWDDAFSAGNWDDYTFGAAAGGNARVSKQLSVGANLQNTAAYDNNSARISMHMPTATGFERWQISEHILDVTAGSARFGLRWYVYSDVNTFRLEAAQGCYWNGTHWAVTTPAPSTSHLIRFGADGIEHYVQDNPTGGSWADATLYPIGTPSLGGWTRRAYYLSSTLDPGANVIPNALYAKSFPKALGTVTVGSAGPALIASSDLNVSSIVAAGTPGSLVFTVTFRKPMANGDYVVLPSITVPSGAYHPYVVGGTKGTASFQIGIKNNSSVDVDVGPAGPDGTVMFAVFGDQAP